MSSGKHQPAEPNPSGPPRRAPVANTDLRTDLRVVLKGEDLLERAHAVGAGIDQRVRELMSQGAVSAVGRTPPGRTAEPAAALAARLLGRLLDGCVGKRARE
jgi:hypothetical protein